MRLAIHERQHLWLIDRRIRLSFAMFIERGLRFPTFKQKESCCVIIRLIGLKSEATWLRAREPTRLGEQLSDGARLPPI